MPEVGEADGEKGGAVEVKRGQKPIPTHLKVLNGNPGRRKLPKNEPAPTTGLPQPPEGLKEDRKQAWVELAEKLARCGMGTQLDSTAFEMLVNSYCDLRDASKKVAETGPVWLERGEGTIPKFVYSPYWVIQNKEWKKLYQMLAEFGMTPSSRTRVQREINEPQQDDENRFFG